MIRFRSARQTLASATFAIVFIGTITGAASAQSIAITNAKAWTGTDAGTIEGATVLVTDGTISAVGADVAIPEGTTTIDAAGKWVTPGIVAPFSQIGLVEVGAEDSTNDTSGAQTPYSVALRAVDGFNPSATPVDASMIEGITRIVVAPSAGMSIFAGQGFTADTSGRLDSVMDDRAFVHVRLGEGGAGVAGGSRPAAWTYFRAAIADARTFPARFLAHNEGDALTRVDAQALGEASRGQQLIVFEAHRASDLKLIMDFAEANDALEIAIVGAAEGWLVAEDLAASGIPIIVNPFDNLPVSFQALAASQENTARLIDAGVTVAIANLDSLGHQARLTLQVAGGAVAHGVSHDDALAAITHVPAGIFGMEGVGTLAVGSVGDVVVWDGDPLEIMSSPDVVIIDGEIQALESRQTRLRDRYLGLDAGSQPFAYKRSATGDDSGK
ncbi:MAG: amidohydrolase family protein [Pseudomonadota bacterium]